jgi:hypothetical protein
LQIRREKASVALDIDRHDLKKQDPLLKAGFSRWGMEPVCPELESSCLPKSLKTIEKAQALAVTAKFGDGSLFNSPLLVIDGTNVESVDSLDEITSDDKEELKKIPLLSSQ